MTLIARTLIRRLAPAPALVIAVLGCREDAESPTAPESGPPRDITSAHVLSFRHVTAGAFHSCGVTTDNLAYCWGTSFSGLLGDGTNNVRRIRPVPVAGGLHFRRVEAGPFHTCGVTTDDLAYCWGRNGYGEIGNGTFDAALTPAAVAGGLHFRAVTTSGGIGGIAHSCGVTTSNRAYCWGNNESGQLGTPTAFSSSAVPVAVAGGLSFRQVSAGGFHTCGVTTDNRAYCWGWNASGRLGNGKTDETIHVVPVAVVGGLRFRQVSSSGSHTCGVTTDSRVFCWGDNFVGQLGEGTNTGPELCNDFACSTRPVAAAGGRRFVRVSAGFGGYTCAVNPYERVFCWGNNDAAQLGDNTTTTPQLTPVRVAGGLRWRSVSGGEVHTCGVTPDNLAYCWGRNERGQLGDGTLIAIRRKPAPVAGPS
jgi:alpha-tubulin suppressor-like RCC1 family protein